MNKTTIISPSNQVRSTLPDFVSETYKEFVKFMTTADQSEERIGFSQDLLQNLQKYRDFNNYKQEIIEYGSLAVNLTVDSDELTLESGYGFPDENGILYINNEIILYREKVGNVFSGLQRGASGTVILPTFTQEGTYLNTVPTKHTIGSSVQNLSVIFLVSFLETIYKSYAPDINSSRVSPEVDNMTFLENIRDFFQSKGSKLGIKALFKLLFAENDVDVNYPGDRMIVPSKSTWSESLIMRTVPIPRNLVDSYANYAVPTKMQNSVVFLKSYNTEDTLATSICDYVSAYPYEDNIQYEMYLNKDKNSGEFFPNPVTELTRATYLTITSNTGITDITTITVESTLGFANSGVFFIEQEGIQYTSKSLNQFFGCKRGHIGIEAEHAIGSKVYGPLYIEAKTKLDGIDYTSFSWPLGLVKDVDVVDPGLLHKESDVVYINGPGRIDPRVQALTSFVENYDEELVSQAQFEPEMTFVQNYTAGVSGVYFDKDYVFVGSSGFPYYNIGPFSGTSSSDFVPAETIGPNLEAKDTIYVIPRELRENTNILDKGTDEIAIAVDGVPIYSEVSPVDLIQGQIKTFDIINRGAGYLNPTVLLDPPASIAEARVVNGQITLILQKTTGNYRGIPSVRITSGEGASFHTGFDNYGRLTSVEINNPGEYYKDVPSLSVVDSSGRGTGALVSCTVEGRVITSVTIEQPGIDYNPLTTSIVTTPIGQGAVVEAVVENYRFNRYQSIVSIPNWTFDAGNGFLWGDEENGLHSTFGYICDPVALRYKLGDTAGSSTRGDLHSPIIGWAFDGNPIYGPWGWTNGKNDSGGVELQISGYVLRSDRSALGTEPPLVGPYNPATTTYPMGTFVEDYVYQPPLVSDILLTTDAGGDFLTTETGLDLSTDSQNTAINVLDTNNGRVCNTPEYPEDLYPNGVFCYFTTITEAGAPQFPYLIGTTFNNRPISQKMSVASDGISPDFLQGPVYSPSSYDDTELTFNFTNVERFRNPYLSETKQDVDLKIADVTSGSISSIIVESGLPATTKCGDILYYDDTNQDGTGAEGKVSFVTGENILNARGSLVYTYLRSHRQLLDLSSYKGSQSFVFVRDTFILCSSGAIGQVVKWNTDDYSLEVKCLTYDLIKYGDTFYDNRGVFVELPPLADNTFFLKTGQRSTSSALGSLTRPNDIVISYAAPSVSGIDGVDNEPGDLWWSIRVGRLFVWYDDGDTSQWVQTQPMGMQPILNTASDTSVGVSDATTSSALTAGSDTTVTISTMAPDARADGTPNRLGDLWWSNYTGMFYIWYYDLLGPNPNVGIAQWVMATPTGTVPMAGATDYLYPELSTPSVNRGNIYTANLTCIISDAAPLTQVDGSSLEYGNLWWCSVNGKMFIYWDDGDSVQWTQTTPVGAISTLYGDDNPFDPSPGPGPGPYPPDPGGEDNFGVLPEPKDQKLLWFYDMINFLEGDIVNFQLGAPGVDSVTEIAKLEVVGTPDNDNGVFIRGFNDNPLVLPNLTIMVNDTRAIYQVNCDAPTKLLKGDLVFIENSSFPEVNGVHEVVQAGHVIPAILTTQIDEAKGEVTGVTIVDPGKYYEKNFYITFFLGGGQGAYAYATVEPLVLGGRVISVEILEPGSNYISPPTPILGEELTNKQFQIYVYGLYGDDNANVKYSAFGEAVENTAAYVAVTGGGVGYKEIPPALGLYKKIGDRAQLVINKGSVNPEGGSIVDVTVEQGGSRYVSPTAIFSDRLNAGSGATADVSVSNGVVTSVTVTSGGTGYIEPTLTLVEESGKYISLTKTIGRITAGSVINPGRDISVDRSLKPELQITTRCVIRYVNTVRGEFSPGSTIYQGNADVKFVTAKVVSYDDKIQQLTLEKVNGVIKDNELFRDDFGTTALVILNGEADCRALVSGTSEPEGVFINDTSKVSTKYAVIQDSLKYQWFSYEIASPLPRVDYENFVNDIVHPSGFIMFSKLDLNDSIESSLRVSEPEFKPQLP